MRSRRTDLVRAAWWVVAVFGFVAVLILFGDRPIAAAAAGLKGPLAEFLRSITHIGKAQWYLIAIGIALLPLAIWRRQTRSARDAALLAWAIAALLFLAACVALPGLIADLVKFLGGRPRPHMLDDWPYFDFAPFGLDSDFHSFPSGHATTLFGLAFAVALFLPRLRWVLLPLAALLSASRMLVNAHYASDLVASAGLAGLTTYALRGWLARRRLVFTRRADGSIAPRVAARLLRRRIARLSLRHLGLTQSPSASSRGGPAA